MKQPFPEVSELPPGRRMKSTPALNQHRASAASHPLQSMDTNGSIPHPTSTNWTSEPYKVDGFTGQGNMSKPFQTATGASCRRESLSSSHHNPGKAQAATIRHNVHGGEKPGVQEDSMLPPPAGSHHGENQTDWAQVPPPGPSREQLLAPHHRNVDGEISPPEAAQTSHIDAAIHWNQVGTETNDQLQPPSQPNSRPQSALSNTAKVRARPLVLDDLLPQGVAEAAVLSTIHPMKIQKSSGGMSRGVKLHPQANTHQQDPLATVSGLRSYLQNLPGIEQALKEYVDQKAVLESQQAEIEKLNLSNKESKEQIQLLQDEKVALAAKVKRFTEISARYKAHMNDVVQAQKHLMDERKKIKTESAEVREQSKAALKAHADRQNHENTLRQLIIKTRDIRPPAEKLEECKELSCI